MIDDLRVDAVVNRERILAAAREVFAEAGLGVTMSRVAARAGVGVATLYRRFPSRDDLVAEAFADQYADCAAFHRAALRDSDPGRAFRSVVVQLCGSQVKDRGFTTAYVAALTSGRGLDRERREAEWVVGRLLDRAKAAGAIRADVGRDDFVLLLHGNAGVIAGSGRDAAEASRRFVRHMLRSFAPDQ
ncbi:TetR/AcrR family transcriptional regulator [Catenuloplanes japonicus]|uniref:TetR/AcrR family transcriptional regulator n=1 Tax=Catenuloplanes japonicus TaxID=33876 RepID=UPI001E47E5C0|nr:TetR/AcrR family transcriptional regulator [Catenuloplanes japonicus]